MECGAPELFRGYFDRCDRELLGGWAYDTARPGEPVELDIRCDGELIGHVVADRYRGDLKETGLLVEGCHSFLCAWPVPPTPFASHIVDIRRVSDGAPLSGSPRNLPPATSFDEPARAWLAAVLRDTAQAAALPQDIEAIAGYLAVQIEMLLAARARLDGGAREAALALEARWGGLMPSPSVAAATAPLKPQALFLDAEFPIEHDNAGANAALDHMRSLGRLGFDLRFAAAHDLEDKNRRALTLAARDITALTAPWYASVEEILRRHAGKIDLVYVHRAEIAATYAKLIRRHCPEAVFVYGVADLHHLRLARQAELHKRTVLQQQARVLQLEELMTARLADAVITHSTAEAALLRQQMPGLTVAVVPWAVPLRRSTTDFAAREGVVFVGNFAHPPNIDAVHFLAGSILPWVRRKAPEIVFRIVGSNMPDELRRIAQPGLEIIGAVEDIGVVLGAARLSVAPLRFGAGLKGKVIESLAAGVPCIGTGMAYEGMDIPAALAPCIVDNAEPLAAAIVQLYHDPAALTTIAAAGQRYASVTFGEAAVDAQMRQVVLPVLQRWAGLSAAG